MICWPIILFGIVLLAGPVLAIMSSTVDEIKQVDDKVDVDELEDGLHKIIDTGNTEGLHYFVELIHSQEAKLEKQMETVRNHSHDRHDDAKNGPLAEEEVKVHDALHRLHNIETEAEDALHRMGESGHSQLGSHPVAGDKY